MSCSCLFVGIGPTSYVPQGKWLPRSASIARFTLAFRQAEYFGASFLLSRDTAVSGSGVTKKTHEIRPKEDAPFSSLAQFFPASATPAGSSPPPLRSSVTLPRRPGGRLLIVGATTRCTVERKRPPLQSARQSPMKRWCAVENDKRQRKKDTVRHLNLVQSRNLGKQS